MTRKQYITAIITDKRGRVLSVGKNSYTKTHTLMAKHANKVGMPHRTFLHAEADAIIRCKDLSKAHKISVYRFSNEGSPLQGKPSQGKPLLAKPCAVCQSLINATPIKVVEHT
jgi:deoxycytidylate deaminase